MMKFPTIFAVVAAVALFAGAVAEEKKDEKQEKPFPAYEAVVTARRVNIRSGPSTNYTRLMRANPGYRVLVTGEHNDWLRIGMPAECLLWVSKDYVKLDVQTKIGEVTAENVNVRVAPKLGADVVGQVNEGMFLVVTSSEGEWYEVRPPSTTSAWVHRDFVERAATGK